MRMNKLGWALVLLTALGCPPAKPPVAPQPPPPPAAPPQGATVEPPGLENGDFEREAMAPWTSTAKGYTAELDATVAHGGTRSLRLQRSGEESPFGAVGQSIPLPGKPVKLKLRGWVRSADAGGVTMWARADGEGKNGLAFKNTQNQKVDGTTDWQQLELVLEAPAEAKVVRVGMVLSGAGRAWLDDVSATLSEQRPPSERVFTGTVVAAGGQPVAGATVALVSPMSSKPAARARTDATGRFELRAMTGRYGVTATSAEHAARYRPTEELDVDTGPIALTMAADGFNVQGRVEAGGKPVPPGSEVLVSRISQFDSDLFVVAVGPEGQFAVKLPPWEGGYELTAVGEGFFSRGVSLGGKDDQRAVVELIARDPVPADVAAAVKGRAVPLKTAEAGNGFADLEPLGKMIGSARIVGLGEGTHATREFFQMKHRILEYLVEKKGFTVFAIEANWPECMAINDYVLHGKGEAKKALAGIYFWVWNTEEVLGMIEWMRRYNADPAHKKKVAFQGFDMQVTVVAAARLVEYLKSVDEALATQAAAKLAKLDEPALAEVEGRFDADRKAWVAKKGQPAWVEARQHLRILRQAQLVQMGGPEARDVAMADNVRWLVAQQAKGTKMVLWAHDGHIMKHRGLMAPMGQLLEKAYGKDYVPIGMLFGEGSFRANNPNGRGLQEFTIGPPPADDVAGLFAGLSLAALDVRALPPKVASWLETPRLRRMIGAAYGGDEATMEQPAQLTKEFEIVLWFAKTTTARPVAP